MNKEETEDQSVVAQRLNELIKVKHISKADMARIADVSPQSVNGWFKRGSISKAAASKIASAVGVSLTWLLGGNEETSESLTSEEKKLIEIYRQLPSSEQTNMLGAFEMRLKELKNYYDKYIARN